MTTLESPATGAYKILVIEDDASLRRTLADRLRAEGYAPLLSADGFDGLERAVSEEPEAMILDVMLPRMSGFDICRELRNRGVTTPIVMLTARADTDNKLSGFRLGADDYIAKPFDMAELMARLQALLRRAYRSVERRASAPRAYSFGEYTLNAEQMTLAKNLEIIEISTREFHLLHYLLLRRGCVVRREELLHAVWGYEIAPDTRTVDTHITWLRHRIEPNPKIPRYILTVHGEGYKFVG